MTMSNNHKNNNSINNNNNNNGDDGNAKNKSNIIIYLQIYDERVTNFNQNVFLVFDMFHLL